MTAKTRAYIELVRLPNVFTAIADVTAGFLYMGGRWGDLGAWGLLAGASACLYAGGVALNDLFDAKRDANERPERPIPSGRISRSAGAIVSLVLMCTGMALGRAWSAQAGALAAGMVIAVILYNGPFKHTVAGPWLMGTCRALNLALGMSVFPEYRTIFGILPVLFVHGLYVTSVTFFARRETQAGHAKRLKMGTAGIGFAVVGLVLLCLLVPRPHFSYLLLVVGLAAYLLRRGMDAAREPTPARIQRTVGTFITSLVFFDSCIAWAARGPVGAIAVLVWLVPTQLTKRWSRMT